MASTGNTIIYNIDTGILKKDACVILIKTEWNAAIVNELEAGCLKILEQYHIRSKTLVVPGAMEIPFSIKRYWEKNKDNDKDKPDAFIVFACIIKGDTPHFDYVCNAITNGVLQLNITLPIPTIFGVLTVNNNEQAIERIGGKHGHKGTEAALTAIKMIE